MKPSLVSLLPFRSSEKFRSRSPSPVQPSIAFSCAAARARARFLFGTERPLLLFSKSGRDRAVTPLRVLRGIVVAVAMSACLAAQAQGSGNLGRLVDSGHVKFVKITPELVSQIGAKQQPAAPQEL